MLRYRLCCQDFFDVWYSTTWHVSYIRKKYWASYCKNTLRFRFLFVTKLSNKTLDIRFRQVFVRAIIIFFCLSEIVKQSKDVEDYLISSISTTANSTIYQRISLAVTKSKKTRLYATIYLQDRNLTQSNSK